MAAAGWGLWSDGGGGGGALKQKLHVIVDRLKIAGGVRLFTDTRDTIVKRGHLDNWKYINQDFDSTENKARKEEFKALVLDRIHLPTGRELMTNSKGPDDANCKCSYFSNYEIDRFLHDADSIYTLLARKYNKNIMIIGIGAHSVANLMFIINLHGKNKGFYYDLMERKSRVYKGVELDKLAKNLVLDSAFLHTSKYDPDLVDHDSGFFVSFNYSKSQFVEICLSQLSGENYKRPFAVAVGSYWSDFRLSGK